MQAALALACYLLSGFAGLIYQTVWMRELVTIYGSTIYASGAVLAAFMGGLALGSALGSRWLGAGNDASFRSYGVLEIVIGVAGLGSQAMMSANQWIEVHWIGFLPMGFASFFVKGLAALPFMLLPTAAMGATFPVFVRAFSRSMEGAGRRLATAYAMNTLGAVAGTLSAAFLFIPAYGLRSTLWIAAAVNLAVGVVALRLPHPRATPPLRSTPAPRAARRRAIPVVVYFLTGFAAIAAEVVWTRVLVLHFGNSVQAYALMLALVLLGIGVGSLVATRFADRVTVRSWFLATAGLGVVLVLHLHPLGSLDALAAWLARLVAPTGYAVAAGVLSLSAFLTLAVPTLLMGIIFPLGIRVLSTTPEELGAESGRLYAVNSAGAIVAAVVTPVFLLGGLGVNATTYLLACIYFLCAFLIGGWLSQQAGRFRMVLPIAVGLPVLLALSVPGRPVVGRVAEKPHTRLLDFRESATGTVTVTEGERQWYRYRLIETNGVNVAGTTPSLLVIQKLQAHLPLLLHPAPRSVLHIGFGSGGTAYSVSRHPVKRIDIAEISPDVVEMSRKHFAEVNHGVPWQDPRVRFLWGDGRDYLISSGQRYDVILSDSVHPAYAGNGSLYTLEYFEHAAASLEPDGVFSMWLPIYWLDHANFLQILKAFQLVFPDTLVWYVHNTINRFVVVTGRLAPGARLPGPEIVARLAAPGVAEDLAEIGLDHPLAILDNLLLGTVQLRAGLDGVEPHQDDRPTVEYQSGRAVDPNHGWVRNFEWMVARRESFLDYLPRDSPWPRELLERYDAAARGVVEGHLEFLHCRTAAAGELFARSVSLLPEHREPWEFTRSGMFESLSPPWCGARATATSDLPD